MHTKTIAWEDCHEFDEAIAQINKEQADGHAKETEIWKRLFQMGAVYVKKDN